MLAADAPSSVAAQEGVSRNARQPARAAEGEFTLRKPPPRARPKLQSADEVAAEAAVRTTARRLGAGLVRRTTDSGAGGGAGLGGGAHLFSLLSVPAELTCTPSNAANTGLSRRCSFSTLDVSRRATQRWRSTIATGAGPPLTPPTQGKGTSVPQPSPSVLARRTPRAVTMLPGEAPNSSASSHAHPHAKRSGAGLTINVLEETVTDLEASLASVSSVTHRDSFRRRSASRRGSKLAGGGGGASSVGEGGADPYPTKAAAGAPPLLSLIGRPSDHGGGGASPGLPADSSATSFASSAASAAHLVEREYTEAELTANPSLRKLTSVWRKLQLADAIVQEAHEQAPPRRVRTDAERQRQLMQLEKAKVLLLLGRTCNLERNLEEMLDLMATQESAAARQARSVVTATPTAHADSLSGDSPAAAKTIAGSTTEAPAPASAPLNAAQRHKRLRALNAALLERRVTSDDVNLKMLHRLVSQLSSLADDTQTQVPSAAVAASRRARNDALAFVPSYKDLFHLIDDLDLSGGDTPELLGSLSVPRLGSAPAAAAAEKRGGLQSPSRAAHPPSCEASVSLSASAPSARERGRLSVTEPSVVAFSLLHDESAASAEEPPPPVRRGAPRSRAAEGLNLLGFMLDAIPESHVEAVDRAALAAGRPITAPAATPCSAQRGKHAAAPRAADHSGAGDAPPPVQEPEDYDELAEKAGARWAGAEGRAAAEGSEDWSGSDGDHAHEGGDEELGATARGRLHSASAARERRPSTAAPYSPSRAAGDGRPLAHAQSAPHAGETVLLPLRSNLLQDLRRLYPQFDYAKFIEQRRGGRRPSLSAKAEDAYATEMEEALERRRQLNAARQAHEEEGKEMNSMLLMMGKRSSMTTSRIGSANTMGSRRSFCSRGSRLPSMHGPAPGVPHENSSGAAASPTRLAVPPFSQRPPTSGAAPLEESKHSTDASVEVELHQTETAKEALLFEEVLPCGLTFSVVRQSLTGPLVADGASTRATRRATRDGQLHNPATSAAGAAPSAGDGEAVAAYRVRVTNNLSSSAAVAVLQWIVKKVPHGFSVRPDSGLEVSGPKITAIVNPGQTQLLLDLTPDTAGPTGKGKRPPRKPAAKQKATVTASLLRDMLVFSGELSTGFDSFSALGTSFVGGHGGGADEDTMDVLSIASDDAAAAAPKASGATVATKAVKKQKKAVPARAAVPAAKAPAPAVPAPAVPAPAVPAPAAPVPAAELFVISPPPSPTAQDEAAAPESEATENNLVVLSVVQMAATAEEEPSLHARHASASLPLLPVLTETESEDAVAALVGCIDPADGEGTEDAHTAEEVAAELLDALAQDPEAEDHGGPRGDDEPATEDAAAKEADAAEDPSDAHPPPSPVERRASDLASVRDEEPAAEAAATLVATPPTSSVSPPVPATPTAAATAAQSVEDVPFTAYEPPATQLPAPTRSRLSSAIPRGSRVSELVVSLTAEGSQLALLPQLPCASRAGSAAPLSAVLSPPAASVSVPSRRVSAAEAATPCGAADTTPLQGKAVEGEGGSAGGPEPVAIDATAAAPAGDGRARAQAPSSAEATRTRARHRREPQPVQRKPFTGTIAPHVLLDEGRPAAAAKARDGAGGASGAAKEELGLGLSFSAIDDVNDGGRGIVLEPAPEVYTARVAGTQRVNVLLPDGTGAGEVTGKLRGVAAQYDTARTGRSSKRSNGAAPTEPQTSSAAPATATAGAQTPQEKERAESKVRTTRMVQRLLRSVVADEARAIARGVDAASAGGGSGLGGADGPEMDELRAQARALFLSDPARYDAVVDDLVRLAVSRLEDASSSSAVEPASPGAGSRQPAGEGMPACPATGEADSATPAAAEAPSALSSPIPRHLPLRNSLCDGDAAEHVAVGRAAGGDGGCGARDGDGSRRSPADSTVHSARPSVSGNAVSSAGGVAYTVDHSAGRVAAAEPTGKDSADEVRRILMDQMKARLLVRSIVAQMRALWARKQERTHDRARSRAAADDQAMARAQEICWRVERHRVVLLTKLINLLDRKVNRVHGWLPFYRDDNVLVDASGCDLCQGANDARAVCPHCAHHHSDTKFSNSHRMHRAIYLARRRKLLPLRMVLPPRTEDRSNGPRYLLFGYRRHVVVLSTSAQAVARASSLAAAGHRSSKSNLSERLRTPPLVAADSAAGARTESQHQGRLLPPAVAGPTTVSLKVMQFRADDGEAQTTLPATAMARRGPALSTMASSATLFYTDRAARTNDGGSGADEGAGLAALVPQSDNPHALPTITQMLRQYQKRRSRVVK